MLEAAPHIEKTGYEKCLTEFKKYLTAKKEKAKTDTEVKVIDAMLAKCMEMKKKLRG